MTPLITPQTKIITQGITGRMGRIHTQICLNYGHGRSHYVAGVHPKKADESIFDLPIYASVQDAAKATGATVSVIYVPAPNAANAIWEAVKAQMDLVVCITEGIPAQDLLQLFNRMRQQEETTEKHTFLLGPNASGLLIPNQVKIGVMPDLAYRSGRIGIISHSGALSYEVGSQLSSLGLGVSMVLGIGSDHLRGASYLECLKLLNNDPQTDAIVVLGGTEGSDEIKAAQWYRSNMSKPVVGFITGLTVPPKKQMGHLAFWLNQKDKTAEEKLSILRNCGFVVTRNPAEIGRLIQKITE